MPYLDSSAARTVKLYLNGTRINADSGFAAWVQPEADTVIISDVVLVITTVSTGACTLDIGTTATSATTSSDNIFDGIDATVTAPAVNSMRVAALDSGANVEAKSLASGKWITVDEKTGDATGMIGVLYITYLVGV